MKTLANCTPTEFLRQTNKIRHAVEELLKDSKVGDIRKRLPEFTGKETQEKKKAMLNEQAKKNLGDILDALMEENAEKTADVLGMMCFLEPGEIGNYTSVEIMGPALELLYSKPVLDFLSLLMRSEPTNTAT